MNERVSLPEPDRNHTVFIHCPPEPEFREHLCALTLAVIASGHGVKGDFDPFDTDNPQLDDLANYICESRYSIHDCSLCHIPIDTARLYGRYNVPIELGMAIAERYRLQRIYNQYTEIPFHEMLVFVKRTHPYQDKLTAIIKVNDIRPYDSTYQILRDTFRWLLRKKTSFPNPPEFEQVNQVWVTFKEQHERKYCDNDPGNGINKDDLCNDILQICREAEWWQEPQWISEQNNYYDVFLAHNSKDKNTVKQIANILRDSGLKYWIDDERIRPGGPISIIEQLQQEIAKCKSIAIFFSENGLGPWQTRELAAAMSLCFQYEKVVIPVLLPNFSDMSKLPLFIQTFRWVKFSTINDPVAIRDLIWGITGERN